MNPKIHKTSIKNITYISRFGIFIHTEERKLEKAANISITPHSNDLQLQPEVIKDLYFQIDNALFEHGRIIGRPFVHVDHMIGGETAHYSSELFMIVDSKYYPLEGTGDTEDEENSKELEKHLLSTQNLKAISFPVPPPASDVLLSTFSAEFEVLRYMSTPGVQSLATIQITSRLVNLQEQHNVFAELYQILAETLEQTGEVAGLPFAYPIHAIPDQNTTVIPRMLLNAKINGIHEVVSLTGNNKPFDRMELEVEYLKAQGVII